MTGPAGALNGHAEGTTPVWIDCDAGVDDAQGEQAPCMSGIS